MSGHVGQFERAVGQQRGRHQLEHRVLRTGHHDGARQRTRCSARRSWARRRRSPRSNSWPTSMLRPWSQAGEFSSGAGPTPPTSDPDCCAPRDDLLLESPPATAGAGRVRTSRCGPSSGRPRARSRRTPRTVEADDGQLVETTSVPRRHPVVRVAVPMAGPPGPRPRGIVEQLVGAARPARRHPDPRGRPARRCIDECGVRQHALHADGELRRRRLRRRATPRSASPVRSSAPASSSRSPPP